MAREFENCRALICGVANYASIRRLPASVVEDAREMHASLIDPMACGYLGSNVTLLLDGCASKSKIQDVLRLLAEQCDGASTLLIYFSGHGGRIAEGEYAGEYLLPVDCRATSARELAETSITGKEFVASVKAVRSRRVVVILDCCHASGIGDVKNVDAQEMKEGLSEPYLEKLKAGKGRVVFASCRDNEFSYVLPNDRNSLFTKHLLAGLRGGVPSPDGLVRVFDVFHYLQSRVTADREEQHPVFKCEIEENFPIALWKGGKAAPAESKPVPQDDFRYDVFLSYRQEEPDRSWVQAILKPALESRGVRVCIDNRDFRLGVPLVKEMERAVEQSRYTLGILSPRYLTSNFAEMEAVLALHLGLERKQRRFVAAMRENCRPGLDVRARLWLDMTDDREFEANVARLAYELRGPADL